MADGNQPVIIIKKVKKGGGGHHGGAWKVAYADFVTAMMAFFLLLWLLNVTTAEQKAGLADYFAPTAASKSENGAGGVMGGQTVIVDGAKISDRGHVNVTVALAPPAQDTPGMKYKDNDKDFTKDKDKDGSLDEEELKRQLAEREQKAFEDARDQIRQAIQDVPELSDLKRNLIIDMTPEGLRIQLVDQDRQSMFPSGTADMHDRTRLLLQKVSQIVSRLPNRISISGHTDATPFRGGDNGYGNWELSTDRANASRRVIVDSGIPAGRIDNVIGKADSDPLISSDPTNPANRRISIVLLREKQAAAPPAPAVEAPVIPPSLQR
ncbi:flagellar motor protein MotB [Desertibaculum subflavum]|uniref:flagellar motor protein MotB n=1 Tax=Desertibaculum subflavum TaxID=2268458 RepID=UPI000E66F819